LKFARQRLPSGTRFQKERNKRGEKYMKLKNILIVVKNIEKSIHFYKSLFGLQVILNTDTNVILTEGLVLQDASVWKDAISREILPKNNASLLYFEEHDIEVFMEKLNTYGEPIQYVTPLTTLDSGQKIVRLYDPDGNLIEVRTSLSSAIK